MDRIVFYEGFLLLSLVMHVVYSGNSPNCLASNSLTVYGVNFDNCSMSIFWKSPMVQECSASVSHYTVIFHGKDCSKNWKTVTLQSNKTSLVLNDEEIVTACITGECYFQVTAKVRIDYSTPAQLINSSCVMISESYYERLQPYAYNSSELGQEVCIPFRLCSGRLLPTFILNDTAIPVNSDINNAYYIFGGKFCFSKLESNVILYETCVAARPTCSVCSNYTGEMTIMSRSELITSAHAGSHPPAVAKNADEVCNFPTVIFCGSSYTLSNNSTTVTVCVCVPFNKSIDSEVALLYELRNENRSSAKMQFVSNSVVSILSLDSSEKHCIEIESLDCIQNNTYLSVCINGNSSRDMVYLPEPCELIQVISNSTDECTTVTVTKAKLSVGKIISITLGVIVILCFVICLSIIIYIRKQYSVRKKGTYDQVGADDK